MSEAERWRDSDESLRVLLKVVAEVLSVRLLEAAEQRAGSSATKSRAKPQTT